MLEKRKTPVGLYVTLGIMLLIVSYYISGLFTFEDLSMNNMQNYLVYIALHFWQITRWYNEKTIPIMGLGFLGWVFLIYYFMLYYRNYQEGSHGTEEWADIKDVNRRRRSKVEDDNMILSKNIAVDTCGEKRMSNNNTLILASSGKGKTTGYIVPNLLRAHDQFIVLDVKGELQFKYGKYLQEKGYTIRSLNMKEPDKSDRFNPYVYIYRDQDLIRMIENIYDSLEPPDAVKESPFWEDGPKLYMQALFYYEWFCAKEEKRYGNINNITALCNEQVQLSDHPPKKKGAPPPSVLEVRMMKMREKYGANHPAVRDYFKFIDGAADTVKSIVIIVNSKLKLLELPELKRIFEDDDMHLQDLAYGVGGTKEQPTNKKVAIFLGADDTDRSLNFVFSIFYTLAVNTLCNIADRDFKKNGGALPIPVGFFEDEFYAGARPAEAEVLLGTIRGRNIYMVPVLQSKAQLMVLYPNDKWKIFLDNCSVMAFYGAAPAADETHEWISKLTGDMTFDTAVMQKDRTDFGETGGNLISPAAVKRMPKEDCIIFMEGEFPIYDEKERPWENPDSPYHHAMELNKASEDGGYIHPVEVVWNEKEYRYITVLPDSEPKEFADIDNPEFLHADLRDKNKNTLQKVLKQLAENDVMEDENVPTVGTRKNRDITGEFIDVWLRYSKELSDHEKQIILRASENGVTEDNLKRMFLMEEDQMEEFAIICADGRHGESA